MRTALVACCIVMSCGWSVCQADSKPTTRPASTQPSTTQPTDEHPGKSLINAIERGDSQAALAAIKAGASVDGDPHLTPPLMVAVSCDRTELVQLLLEQGANPNVAQPPCMRTPLMMLRSGPHREKILDLLVTYGADLNVPDWTGRTLLARAASRGNIELIKLLVDHGANPCVRDAAGLTPVLLARRNHYDAAADLLIRRGGGDFY